MDRVGEICLRTWAAAGGRGEKWVGGELVFGVCLLFSFFFFARRGKVWYGENSKRVMEQRFNYLGICPWWEMVLKRLQDFPSF